jgi:hypothetical protein
MGKFFDLMQRIQESKHGRTIVTMIGWALIWLLFSVSIVYGIVLARIYIAQ